MLGKSNIISELLLQPTCIDYDAITMSILDTGNDVYPFGVHIKQLRRRKHRKRFEIQDLELF